MADKQAIILIHGIGEQRPMDTLRGFVEAVWGRDESVHHRYGDPSVWSKPDTISGSFELRRLTTGENRSNLRTDFFEFYWAHLMRGTKLSHVLSWARVLLLRWPWNVPRSLLGVWLLAITATVVVFTFFLYQASLSEEDQLIRMPAWLAGSAGLALSSLAGLTVIQIIGDAARYLTAAPTI